MKKNNLKQKKLLKNDFLWLLIMMLIKSVD